MTHSLEHEMLSHIIRFRHSSFKSRKEGRTDSREKKVWGRVSWAVIVGLLVFRWIKARATKAPEEVM